MITFVYGTLKRGYWNHYLLKGSEYLGPSVTYEKYALYNFKYPFAVHSDNEEEGKLCLPVLGEVYSIDRETLKDLDALEIQYERKGRPIIVEGGVVNALIYEFPHPNPYGFKLLCETEMWDGVPAYVWKG